MGEGEGPGWRRRRAEPGEANAVPAGAELETSLLPRRSFEERERWRSVERSRWKQRHNNPSNPPPLHPRPIVGEELTVIDG